MKDCNKFKELKAFQMYTKTLVMLAGQSDKDIADVIRSAAAYYMNNDKIDTSGMDNMITAFLVDEMYEQIDEADKKRQKNSSSGRKGMTKRYSDKDINNLQSNAVITPLQGGYNPVITQKQEKSEEKQQPNPVITPLQPRYNADITPLQGGYNDDITPLQGGYNPVITPLQPRYNQKEKEKEKENNIFEEKLSDDNFSLSEKISDPTDEQTRKPSKKVAEIIELYNALCVSLPTVKHISGARAKAVNARLKMYSTDDFRELFEKAEASDFLKGQNKSNWTANFDWLVKDANMAKVLDGKYDNSTSQGQFTGQGKPSLWENQMQMLADMRQDCLKEGSG